MQFVQNFSQITLVFYKEPISEITFNSEIKLKNKKLNSGQILFAK